MVIRKAVVDQYQTVRSFYHSVIDSIAGIPNTVGWKKDIYPSPDFLMNSIKNGELFLGEEAEEIVAAMVINHEANDGYRNFNWPMEAEPEEVSVVHALCVHPRYSGQGHAKEMVLHAIETAKENHQKVIRLDVLKGNVPAEKLYSGMGFQYLRTVPMFYEDTGWKEFELYEYAL